MTNKISKTRKTLKEAHGAQDLLPVHPSGAGVQIPDNAALPGQKPVTNGEKKEDMLPTHASEASVEVPDSLASRGNRPVAPALDGQKIADNSGQHGNEEGVEIPANPELPGQQPLHRESVEDDLDLDRLVEEDKDKEEEEKDKKHDGMCEAEDKEDSEEDDKKKMEEHINVLTSGENLSEEFKAKAATLFQVAVNETVARKTEQNKQKLIESYKAALKKRTKVIEEKVIDKIDGYLNYTVEEYLEENALAVEQGLKTKITEEFISGLKCLFENHYIEVPKDKEPVLENLQKEVDELKAALNEEMNKNIQLKKEIDVKERDVLLAQFSEGLSLNEAEKFASLCEGVAFDSKEQFEKKLQVIKENYFPRSVKSGNDLDAQIVTDGGLTKPQENSSQNPVMAAYTDAITRAIKK